MKFLFLTQSYYPDRCGVANVVSYLAEGLVDQGHEVTVFTEKRNRAIISQNGVNIKEFECRGNAAVGYQGEVQRYRDEVAAFTGDVIVAECAQVWCTDLILPILEQLKPLCVLHSHDFSYFKRKPKNPVTNIRWLLYFRRLARSVFNFNAVFVLDHSLSDKRWLESVGYKNVFELPNAANQRYFQEGAELTDTVCSNFGLEVGAYVISVANYSLIKNQKGLIKSYLKSGNEIDLVLIGSKFNAYSDSILKEIAARKKNPVERTKPRIYVLADLKPEEHLALLRGARAFVYASRLEAFPLVIVESIVSEVPWVSTDVGCVRNLPGGVVASNHRKLSSILEKVLNDDLKLAELRNICAKEKRRFCPEQIVILFLKTINDIQLKSKIVEQSI